MSRMVLSFLGLPFTVALAQPERAGTVPATPGAPPDSAVLAVLRSALGSQQQLAESFCGFSESTSPGQFQIEGGRVSRRGQYNTTEKFWPFELLMDGVCTPSRMANVVGFQHTPFVAVIQLRLTTDDFGDPLVRLVRTETIPPSPVGWMRFDARRLARNQREFQGRAGRFTSSQERLRFNASNGVAVPAILARDEGWWAYLSHQGAGDTLCVIASGVDNPLVRTMGDRC